MCPVAIKSYDSSYARPHLKRKVRGLFVRCVSILSELALETMLWLASLHESKEYFNIVIAVGRSGLVASIIVACSGIKNPFTALQLLK